MRLFSRVTIIGLGLIGGSLGLAIKEKRIASEVVGVSRRKSTIRKALSLGAVDRVTLDLKKGVKGSDLVILAVPVFKIVEIAKAVSRYIEKGAILTDVGSTKDYVVKEIESIMPKGMYFVGAHPLAGSERSGVRFSNKDLFKGAICILTKTSSTNPKALGKIKDFWRALGMKVVIMAPEMHDKVVSRISHLSHLTAVSLVNSVEAKDLNFAAGGFKDTTRIVSGEPELWNDIFLTNKSNLLKDISRLKKELARIESALKNNDKIALLKLLNRAKVIRDSI